MLRLVVQEAAQAGQGGADVFAAGCRSVASRAVRHGWDLGAQGGPLAP